MSTLADARWFAVQVRPRGEKVIAQLLRFKGYEEFIPLYKSKRRGSDRIIDLELPLFPSYIFVRFSARAHGPIVTTPGVVRIVGYGKVPVAVENQEIDFLQKIVQSELVADPWPFVHVGERVHIAKGPLTGAEGIVLRLKNNWRLVVSVSLLQRSVAVEIDGNWITPSDRARSSYGQADT